jgi:peptidoglycan/xylan/chitin deacetylase (PgdA/CDA1 family)
MAIFSLVAVVLAGVLLKSCEQIDETYSVTEPPALVATTPSRIAITIDDLPYVLPSKTSAADGLRYVDSINAALRKHGIVATGFAVGGQINDASKPALQAFADAGHTIGNHSWSHPDYGTLSTKEFQSETEKTDEILSEWLTGPRYYRFPFLREGETEATKAAAEQILTDLGYQNVPVTIDNDEWKFNADYLDALSDGKTEKADRIATAYVQHMQERTGFFQSLAVAELGGDVDHVLLIHLNRINADHLETLLDWYVAQDWAFITVGQALQHPVFSQADIYAGARGLSQIERVLGGKRD